MISHFIRIIVALCASVVFPGDVIEKCTTELQIISEQTTLSELHVYTEEDSKPNVSDFQENNLRGLSKYIDM